MNFAYVIANSGLTKIELAAMYGVSRQSIHGWATTAPPREGTLLARQAEAITKALCAAIDRKLLPFAAMNKEARRSHVAHMAERLQGLKPAPR